MKLLLIAFGKPLFGLLAGAGFWPVGMASERVLKAQEFELRAVEAQEFRLEELQDRARVLPDAKRDDAPEPQAEEKAEKDQPDE